MNRILQNTLLKRYHIFFDYLKEDKRDIMLPIYFGIECGDGWFIILDTLMYRIKEYCHYHKVEPIEIKQIKEKFGTLSFYYSGGDSHISGIVSMATHMSTRTCEFCGTTNNVGRTEQWISIICKDCHSTHLRRKDLKWNPNNNNRLLKLSKLNKILNDKQK